VSLCPCLHRSERRGEELHHGGELGRDGRMDDVLCGHERAIYQVIEILPLSGFGSDFRFDLRRLAFRNRMMIHGKMSRPRGVGS
jgi:hypothetical protein